MRLLHSILAAAILAAADYTATAQTQEKPELKLPADIWDAAAKGDVEAIKVFLANDNKIGGLKQKRLFDPAHLGPDRPDSGSGVRLGQWREYQPAEQKQKNTATLHRPA